VGSRGPEFTVITPTLNAAEYLGPCAASVAQQRHDGVDVEHLIVDDGSEDGTLEIAEAAGCRVLQGRRRGLYDAMNAGSQAARGAVVSVLGGDDLLLPGALKMVHERLQGSPSPWLVGGLRWIDAAGSFLGYIGPPPAWMSVRAYAALGWSCIHHQSTFMRRTFLQDLGGFRPAYRVAGDYELLARALETSAFDRVNRPLACFRRHGNNLSMSSGVVAENRLVLDAFGPSSRVGQLLMGQSLRLWLNARHPAWALRKHVPRQQRPLQARSRTTR
jgi:glycosyltransferase involved in cell wall biosynthesis